MENIKMYEEFGGFGGGKRMPVKETFPKRNLKKVEAPEQPYKRDLTKDESSFLFRNFRMHGFSKIDNQGRVILNGGADPRGKYFLTEEDIAYFMAFEKDMI